MKDVFVLVITLGGFQVCRRLRICSRMDALNPEYIDTAMIEAYHLSLRDFFQDKKRAGKHYIYLDTCASAAEQ